MKELIELLKRGGVAVLPTDTIYGLSAVYNNLDAKKRIVDLKSRDNKKAFIVLVSSVKDLDLLGVVLSKEEKALMKKYWPGKLSIVLTRDVGGTIACRLPDNKFLQKIIKQTGPLYSTSANISGQDPATTIKLAKKYFGDKVDIYIDKGELVSESSTVVKFFKGKWQVLRYGAVTIDEIK